MGGFLLALHLASRLLFSTGLIRIWLSTVTSQPQPCTRWRLCNEGWATDLIGRLVHCWRPPIRPQRVGKVIDKTSLRRYDCLSNLSTNVFVPTSCRSHFLVFCFRLSKCNQLRMSYKAYIKTLGSLEPACSARLSKQEKERLNTSNKNMRNGSASFAQSEKVLEIAFRMVVDQCVHGRNVGRNTHSSG